MAAPDDVAAFTVTTSESLSGYNQLCRARCSSRGLRVSCWVPHMAPRIATSMRFAVASAMTTSNTDASPMIRHCDWHALASRAKSKNPKRHFRTTRRPVMAPSIWRTRLRLDVIARWSGRRNPPLSMLPCPLLFWHRDILALAVEHAKTTDEHDLTDHVTSDRIEG